MWREYKRQDYQEFYQRSNSFAIFSYALNFHEIGQLPIDSCRLLQIKFLWIYLNFILKFPSKVLFYAISSILLIFLEDRILYIYQEWLCLFTICEYFRSWLTSKDKQEMHSIDWL